MPKSYSADLRRRVIEAVETGASRREAAESFGIDASSAVRWLQCWNETGRCAPKPRGGSVSPLERHAEQILALVAEQSDLTGGDHCRTAQAADSNQQERDLAVFSAAPPYIHKKRVCAP